MGFLGIMMAVNSVVLANSLSIVWINCLLVFWGCLTLWVLWITVLCCCLRIHWCCLYGCGVLRFGYLYVVAGLSLCVCWFWLVSCRFGLLTYVCLRGFGLLFGVCGL